MVQTLLLKRTLKNEIHQNEQHERRSDENSHKFFVVALVKLLHFLFFLSADSRSHVYLVSGKQGTVSHRTMLTL